MAFNPDPESLRRKLPTHQVGASDLKTAIVGIGYWGSKLLRNLLEMAGVDRLVAVDCRLDRLALACRRYPGLAIADTLEKAIDLHEVDRVIIATPADTHAELALIALSSGIHTLVEKPLATSVREAEQLVNVASTNDLVLMTGHTFLFSPRIRWMTEHITKGMIGRVHYLTSSRQNSGGYNDRTNVIWDLCPHDFSIAFELLGELPISVRATARGLLQPDVPDVAFVTLDFPSGAVASIDVSWVAPIKTRRTLVVGDAGMVAYDDLHDEPIKVFDRSLRSPGNTDRGSDADVHAFRYQFGNTISPHVPYVEPLHEELAAFFAAVEAGNTTPHSDGIFGLEVIRVLHAAETSWRRGGDVVTLERGPLVSPSKSSAKRASNNNNNVVIAERSVIDATKSAARSESAVAAT